MAAPINLGDRVVVTADGDSNQGRVGRVSAFTTMGSIAVKLDGNTALRYFKPGDLRALAEVPADDPQPFESAAAEFGTVANNLRDLQAALSDDGAGLAWSLEKYGPYSAYDGKGGRLEIRGPIALLLKVAAGLPND